ncbi:putative aminopeptidase YsdC [Herpetosiphon gulosus]|uniref:Aminopeptidase YsdC n=2 Tax=Herpetosiphon gulosus TaxID=1973496 RepID=A0ABP9X3R6_9CHLR
MDERLALMKALTDASGVPGNEGPVRAVMAEALAPYGELINDQLGSVAARKAGPEGSPTILLAGHLDEVGFMVTRITDDGFIKFQTLGGWWELVMLAQRVQIETRNGPIAGLIGSKPPHVLSPEARKKLVEKKDMFIDIGASSAAEAREWGVRPGDSILPVCPFTPLHNSKIVMAKAWDNRFGCAAAVEVLHELANQSLPNTVVAGATVQEEVGLRGAATLANVVKPDIAFAIDVCIAGDTPGISKDEAQSKMGAGPVLLLMDSSVIPNPRLRDLVVDTAEELGIPYQFDTMPGGGTDAGRFHLNNAGVPSLALGVATRYIHTHASLLHRDDFDQVVTLLAAVVRKLDQATVDYIKTGQSA